MTADESRLPQLQTILDEFRAVFYSGNSLAGPLDMVLDATNARATGLWQVRGESVDLVGFRGASDMPADVKHDFSVATRSVPLSMTKLGIVKAVISREPALAEVARSEEMQDSAGWLVRFDAVNSLAVPIFSADIPDDSSPADLSPVIGVLAISSGHPLGNNSSADRMMLVLADGLSALLS